MLAHLHEVQLLKVVQHGPEQILIQITVNILIDFAVVILGAHQMITDLEVHLLDYVGREAIILQILRQIS